MASLRQSNRTPSRASSLSRDPSADRAASGAGRTRRSSFFDDDDDNFSSLSKPFKKYSMDNSDFQPSKTSDIRDKIRQIKFDFDTTPSPRKDYQTKEVSWKKETNSRGQPVIKKEELTYTLPETGRNFRRSSITESSSYDSKPQVSSFSTRRSSIGSGLNDDFSTSRSSVRTRKYSEESSSSGFGLPPRPTRHISVEEPKFSSAQSIRDARKLKNSDELTDNIQKMVTKMRNHHLDDAEADIRSISRTVRAASLDPFEDDSPRSRSRQRARLNQFTYGIGKH